MKTKTPDNCRSRICSVLVTLVAALVLLLSRNGASAQNWTSLANPFWNIWLTDYGYSDFLFDNTPGFEGREYLSGEWDTAIGYHRANGTVRSPHFLDQNFYFPDWATLSTFSVKTPMTSQPLNANNPPVAESVITNSDLQITIHAEMLDTVVGTPMAEILESWKKYTAQKANQLLGRQGEFWQADYWDTFMRDSENELETRKYIESNPAKAGLVLDPKAWPWSSARFRDEDGVLKL